MSGPRTIANRWDRLTPREREVLDALITTDGSAAAIAGRLGIRYHTVRSHMTNILATTHLHSRVELAVAWTIYRVRDLDGGSPGMGHWPVTDTEGASR